MLSVYRQDGVLFLSSIAALVSYWLTTQPPWHPVQKCINYARW